MWAIIDPDLWGAQETISGFLIGGVSVGFLLSDIGDSTPIELKGRWFSFGSTHACFY